ncbi:toxin [Nocardioides sp. GY 10113]|uniref:toxin n=1 Tax=Nocardioides sp. GY 10113 TaxID=2569761 RepID=UPI0010A85709|nr:toxin [Nocardioides sp. GY 10113]TIC87750.1 toxin [Nocardioides sp. GY 10113]
MIVHDSALKHGIDPDDAVYAAEHAAYRAAETEEHPVAEFRLGFDPTGRLLELTVLVFDSGNEMLIHAMKARKQYLGLLT